MTPRVLARAGAGLAVLVLAGTAVRFASASSLTVVSDSLGSAATAVPAFYPTSVAGTAGNKPGEPSRNDTITITFSQPVLASSMCAAAATSAAKVTVVLADGGAAADTISVTAGTGCAAPRVGLIDLGSTGYVAGGSVTFSNSTLQLTAASTAVITLGTPPGTATVGVVPGSTVLTYTPDRALTDTSGRAIGSNVASSTPAVQF